MMQPPTGFLGGEAIEEDTAPIAQAKSKHGDDELEEARAVLGSCGREKEVKRVFLELYL